MCSVARAHRRHRYCLLSRPRRFRSLLHLRVGTVDPLLVGYLLGGSIPGALLGTRLSSLLPGQWLKRILCCVLLATGARMLMV
jgi:uncharacterized membrane protein YfcA